MQKYLRACNCAPNYTDNIDGSTNNTPGYLDPQKWAEMIGSPDLAKTTMNANKFDSLDI